MNVDYIKYLTQVGEFTVDQIVEDIISGGYVSSCPTRRQIYSGLRREAALYNMVVDSRTINVVELGYSRQVKILRGRRKVDER